MPFGQLKSFLKTLIGVQYDSVMGGSTHPPYADYDSTHEVPIQQKRRKTGAFVLNW